MPRRPSLACDIDNAELATFNDRFFACLLDLTLVHMTSGLLCFLFLLLGGKEQRPDPAPSPWMQQDQIQAYLDLGLPYIKLWFLYWAIFFLIDAIYNVAYVAISGATPGKEGMGIRVVAANGQKASFIQAANRYLWQQISKLLGVQGHFLFFVRADHRTLYDITSDTIVIKG